jgi:hypothetical protein
MATFVDETGKASQEIWETGTVFQGTTGGFAGRSLSDVGVAEPFLDLGDVGTRSR